MKLKNLINNLFNEKNKKRIPGYSSFISREFALIVCVDAFESVKLTPKPPMKNGLDTVELESKSC